MAERCFHLVRPVDWSQRGTRHWAPPSLESEGFIHASTAAQLAGTLAVHYACESEVCLLELCPRRTAADLRFEASRGGALFPHLYRALEPDDILRWWRLRAANGAWTLPNLEDDAATDEPVGHAGAPPDQLP